MAMHVRPLVHEECEAAGAIIGVSELWRDRYGVTAQKATTDLHRALELGDQVLGVFDDRLRGFSWALPRGAFGHPYLKRIATAPEMRGRGAGSLLLGASMDEFRGRARRYYLLVSDFNTGARKFYERHGFEQIGSLPDFALAGVTELMYVASL